MGAMRAMARRERERFLERVVAIYGEGWLYLSALARPIGDVGRLRCRAPAITSAGARAARRLDWRSIRGARARGCWLGATSTASATGRSRPGGARSPTSGA